MTVLSLRSERWLITCSFLFWKSCDTLCPELRISGKNYWGFETDLRSLFRTAIYRSFRGPHSSWQSYRICSHWPTCLAPRFTVLSAMHITSSSSPRPGSLHSSVQESNLVCACLHSHSSTSLLPSFSQNVALARA